jgi:photosystem II stability/assembly factor-like uncharacterized protein
LRIAFLMTLVLLSAARAHAQAWERLGSEGGLVLSLVADSAGTLYLGTTDGHIFASNDRAASWELRGRAGTRRDAVVAALAPDQRTPGKIFAAVWFREAGAGGGIFWTEDGGRTWAPSGLQGEAARALEISPSQPEMLVAGTRSGVFRSRDSGKTWERISPPGDPELRNVDSVAVDPSQPDLIYAGTYHLPWKTTDGGKTWNSIAAGLIDDSDVMSLRVDASNPARVFLSACSGIYRSDNRGESWIKLQGIPYAARRTQAIVQDPSNPSTLYAATTEGLWVTNDAGESWSRNTSSDWVVNAVVVLPSDEHAAARVIIGTEAQGVLTGEIPGKNFLAANRRFTHQVVKSLAGDPRDPMHLLALLERNGTQLEESRDGGKSWRPLPLRAPAHAAAVAWPPGRIKTVYGSPWGWLAKLNDGTLWKFEAQRETWAPWKSSYTPRTQAQMKKTPKANLARIPLATDTSAPAFSADNMLLPTAEGVLRCDAAAKCSPMSAFARTSRPSAIWVSSDGLALAVAGEGKLGLSRDAGKSASWRSLPAGVRIANWLYSGSPQLTELYLGTERGLYFSTDAGDSWTLIQAGLPAASIRTGSCIAGACLVALEQGGIYASPDARAGWERLDRDAERSRICCFLETQPGKVVFASESEGILQWQLTRKEPRQTLQ